MTSPALPLLLDAASDTPYTTLAWLNAMPHTALASLAERKNISLQQTFKPYILGLQHLSCEVSQALTGQYEAVLLVPSKDKVQSLGFMAQAFQLLPQGGKLIMACENRHGAKSYESALKQLAGSVSSVSKAKCRVFSARKDDALDKALQQQWYAAALPQVVDTHGLWAQAGLFSWKKPDMGSLMLLKHLPGLSGKVMDLCCGYGLLAAHIVRHGDGIRDLHMVDAEALALDCAKKNLADFAPAHWHHLDASCEALPQGMDTVVCNPPFHTGQAKDVALGQRIVAQACAALADGGELYVVANRKLPYEQVLGKHLRMVQCLAEGDGFKVLRGKR